MFLDLSKKINNNLLLDNFEVFRRDYLLFKKQDYFFDYTHNRDEILHSPKKTNYFWQICPLMYNRGDFPNSPDDVKNSNSLKLLRQLEHTPIIAAFSIMAGHTEIPPHADHDDEVTENNQQVPHRMRTTSVVKYHFALDIPSVGDCALIVGNQTKILKNRDLLAFDETDIHSAFNKSNDVRGVLIVSFLKHEIY